MEGIKRLPLAKETGGFSLTATREGDYVSIAKDVYTKVVAKLSGGDINLLNLVKPIELCHPMTFIETIANEEYPFVLQLNLAAKHHSPIQRLKHVVAAAVHSYSMNLSVLRGLIPLSCYVGDTFQADAHDCSVLVQCISDNPEIYRSLITAPDERFTLSALHRLQIKLNSVNSLRGESSGYHLIKFKDSGLELKVTHAQTIIDQIFVGDTSFNLFDAITVESNVGLTAKVTFNFKNSYTVTKIAKGLGSFFGFGQAKVIPTDQTTVEITKTIDDFSEVICRGEGSWLSHLTFDGQLFWTNSVTTPEWKLPRQLLPTDIRNRLDRKLLGEKKQALAKGEVERLQKQKEADRLLRRK